MLRSARLKVKGEPAVYHVISGTALDDFVLGNRVYRQLKNPSAPQAGFPLALQQSCRESSKCKEIGLLKIRSLTHSKLRGMRSLCIFKDHFSSRHEKRPKDIRELEGIFSLKRLSEAI